MKLHVLGSNSAGNGYILEANDTALLIECGMPFKTVLKSLDFNINKIAGCIVSHCHSDHAGFLSSYIERLPVANNIVEHFNSIGISHRKLITIGKWTILPLKMVHDVECYGFVINHKECGNVFFATDTSEVPYNLKGLNHIIIEANFNQECLDEKQINQSIPHFLANRIENSHLSFEKAVDFLIRTNKTAMKNIVLIHLSDSNSDSRMFQKEMQKMTGIETFCAKKNMIIDINF